MKHGYFKVSLVFVSDTYRIPTHKCTCQYVLDAQKPCRMIKNPKICESKSYPLSKSLKDCVPGLRPHTKSQKDCNLSSSVLHCLKDKNK